MPKPYYIIATSDDNGYTVTIPENPNVSAYCADVTDIIPTVTVAKEREINYIPFRFILAIFLSYIILETAGVLAVTQLMLIFLA